MTLTLPSDLVSGIQYRHCSPLGRVQAVLPSAARLCDVHLRHVLRYCRHDSVLTPADRSKIPRFVTRSLFTARNSKADRPCSCPRADFEKRRRVLHHLPRIFDVLCLFLAGWEVRERVDL